MERIFSLLLFAGFFYLIMRFGCGAHAVHGHGKSTPDHDHGHSPATSSIDPVCGMNVPTGQGYTKTQRGHEYRFCSRACLDKFEAAPESYLAA